MHITRRRLVAITIAVILGLTLLTGVWIAFRPDGQGTNGRHYLAENQSLQLAEGALWAFDFNVSQGHTVGIQYGVEISDSSNFTIRLLRGDQVEDFVAGQDVEEWALTTWSSGVVNGTPEATLAAGWYSFVVFCEVESEGACRLLFDLWEILVN